MKKKERERESIFISISHVQFFCTWDMEMICKWDMEMNMDSHSRSFFLSVHP